jgi:hypothetical protein
VPTPYEIAQDRARARRQAESPLRRISRGSERVAMMPWNLLALLAGRLPR